MAQTDDPRFKKALRFTLKWEGGYVNDPDDPGGETNFGISKRAYPDEDIKHLTEQRAAKLYFRDYWKKAGCDLLADDRLAMCHFDAAVNHGIDGADKLLKISGGDSEAYLQAREQHYRNIVAQRPASAKYLRGWMRRVSDLRLALG